MTKQAQVTFARNCFPKSVRLVLDTPEIMDLCVIKCVESAKIWCVRKLNVPLSMDNACEVIFHSKLWFFDEKQKLILCDVIL